MGHEAAELNAGAQKLAAVNKLERQMPPEAVAPLLTQLAELGARMESVTAAAETLAGDARAARFDDLARKADALRQQLLAARNRIGLLEETLTQAVPRITWS